ncbi:DUF1007 family protein [Neomegalonema sp.]|uniref:DUF1007 family protein n=1 Tax=Neomegalonema sp. TaxID=2039713 RepID=UPI002631C872|nr:DUF1007 family protein [Neomegalonema sp.]MDD2868821.1 DUF1007 family protein [Neomegalonema sp.]
MSRRTGAAAALAAALAGGPLAAHPHVFADAQAELLLDDQRRLTGVRLHLVFDEIYTAYMAEALELDADKDGVWTDEEQIFAAEENLNGLDMWNWYVHLRPAGGGAKLALRPAEEAHAMQIGDRFALSYVAPLAEPAALEGEGVELRIYDPYFYASIKLLDAEDGATLEPEDVEGCRLTRAPAHVDRALQKRLLEFAAEETPEIEGVEEPGFVFADRIGLSCG